MFGLDIRVSAVTQRRRVRTGPSIYGYHKACPWRTYVPRQKVKYYCGSSRASDAVALQVAGRREAALST